MSHEIEKAKKTMATPVTYPILGAILVTAGSFLTWVMKVKDSTDQQQHTAIHSEIEATHSEIENHKDYNDARFRLLEHSNNRIEEKLDVVISAQRLQFPLSAPPISSLPVTERPGGAEEKQHDSPPSP